LQASTDSGNVPAALAPVMANLPDSIKPHVMKIFDVLSKPDEARANGMALALTILQLWAVSSCPWFAIFVSVIIVLVQLSDPTIISSKVVMVEGIIHKTFQSIPHLFLVPASFGGIIVTNLLDWMIGGLLSWLLMLLWMALTALFVAEVVTMNCEKEQKFKSQKAD
jgi:hypothetical protein